MSLYFSEYVEGTSNNKALEIRNPYGQPVDLTSCSVRNYANGAATANATVDLVGTIAVNDVFVVCHTGANTELAPLCDLMAGGISFNGDDAVELICDGTPLDVIGQIGYQPPAGEWGTAPTSTLNATLRRRCGVTAGDPNGSNAFSPEVERAGFAVDTFVGLGNPGCAP
jgi:predicted extracellular nuclease